MKSRRIYYRKKNKSIVIEGRLPNSKALLIWTLPDPERFILGLTENASYFPVEKRQKIMEKVMRLDIKKENKPKHSPKVLPRIIKRINKEDAITPSKEEANKLWDITR